MFSGLGLDDYVRGKDSAGDIATGLMATSHLPQEAAKTSPGSPKSLTLEEKRRVMQQSESIKRMQNQPQVRISLSGSFLYST